MISRFIVLGTTLFLVLSLLAPVSALRTTTASTTTSKIFPRSLNYKRIGQAIGESPSDRISRRITGLNVADVNQVELDDFYLRNREQINTIALASFFAFAFYQLLHVDLEAIIALYSYPVEAERYTTALDLLSRLPIDLLTAYEVQVKSNPVLAKAMTSGVSYWLGDILAQFSTVAEQDIGKVDLRRSAKSSIAGFVGHGPIIHYWLNFLDNFHLGCPNYYLNFFYKICLDQGPLAAFLNGVYITIISTLNGKGPTTIIKTVKESTVPGILASIKFWPLIHLITYSPFMPLNFKLLWVDVVEIIWVMILAQLANNDKENLQKLKTTSPEKKSP